MTAVDETRGVEAAEDDDDIDLAAPETRAAGRWHSAGVPTERSKDFGKALRRLVGLMRPEWAIIIVVAAVSIISAACNVYAPRVLGHGTDIIVRGVLSHRGIDFTALHHALFEAVELYAVSAALAVVSAYVLAG